MKGLRQYAACNILASTLPASSECFSNEVARAEQNRKENIAPVPQSSLPFQMPVFSPVINGQGMVTFTVNICPSGPISVGCTGSENYDYLLGGMKLEDLQ